MYKKMIHHILLFYITLSVVCIKVFLVEFIYIKKFVEEWENEQTISILLK